MKKTLLPLLALAAFAVSAHAADWFDAEIAGYTTWPTNPPAGEWSGTAGATLANQALVIDASVAPRSRSRRPRPRTSPSNRWSSA